MKYSQHFLFNTETIITYVREKLNIFKNNSKLQAEEIGDGNINYVFRIRDVNSNKTIIIKQADKLLRSSSRPIESKHNYIEANVLRFYGEVVKDYVPKIYYYDPNMLAIIMEDIRDFKNLRLTLLNGKIVSKFADNITSFIVNSTLITTDIVMDSFVKKDNVSKYVNKEMCKITEDLVFAEPFSNYKNRNIVLKDNLTFIEKELYKDTNLIYEVAKLKDSFMNNSQALIHGDLHTGSIFVKGDKIKIIDPEFAFYGPIGYDLGCVVANLFFSLVNAYINNKNVNFINWLERTIAEIIDFFKIKFLRKYQENVLDISFKNVKFMNWYYDNILKDTAGCCGCELIRRVVGDSKVIDITNIGDINKRIIAERILIKCGKTFILERNNLKNGSDYVEILSNIKKEDFSS